MFRPDSAALAGNGRVGLRGSAETGSAPRGSTCDRGPIMFVTRYICGGSSRAKYSLFTPIRGFVEGLEIG